VKWKRALAASCLAAAVTLAAAGSLDAIARSDDRARDLAATCTGCHGTDGRGSGDMQRLAGETRESLLRALRAFRNGERAATVMGQIARGYSDDELERIAAHFAAQDHGDARR